MLEDSITWRVVIFLHQFFYIKYVALVLILPSVSFPFWSPVEFPKDYTVKTPLLI